MHCFQIIKVWHKLAQGLWLAEGSMIKALPEDVEDPGSNPDSLIQEFRNSNPTAYHVPSKHFISCSGKPAPPLSKSISSHRQNNGKASPSFIKEHLFTQAEQWQQQKLWEIHPQPVLTGAMQHMDIQGWDSICAFLGDSSAISNTSVWTISSAGITERSACLEDDLCPNERVKSISTGCV